jgi:pimeloyl-ACP methyl ester carboxylesterase
MYRMRQSFMTAFAPLSHSMIPLIQGLARRRLLRAGVESHERRLGDIRTHYLYVPSPAPTPVVLIHGIADSALTWSLMIRRLQTIGPVYAIDLPGFGLSGFPSGKHFAGIAEQAQVVHDLLTTVIKQPALLVGNSMGAWVSLKLALQTPALATGIVLIDPGGAMLEGRTSWEPFLETVAVADLRGVRRMLRQMYGRGASLFSIGQCSFQDVFRRDPVVEFVAATDEREFFQPAELRAIQPPTALIWGESDTFLPAGSFEFFRDNLPDPEVFVLKRCGHMPQQERPWQVARIIRDFAERRLTSHTRNAHSR